MPKETLSPMLVDKRVVERNIRKGLVSRDSFDKLLSALPDVAERAEVIQARLHDDDFDDDASDGDDSADAGS